jgi:ribokinase
MPMTHITASHDSHDDPPAIMVVGSCIIDVNVRAESLPARGESLVATGALTQLGGKASNQAIAMARLGGTARLIVRVGDDPWARIAIDRWREEGIDTSFVAIDTDRSTGLGIVVVDPAGENVTLTYPGASAALSPADIHRAEAAIARARVLSAHLNAPLATIEAALRLAKTHGVTTILNVSPPEELPPSLWALIDVCIVNRDEAARLTGVTVDDSQRAIAAAQRLMTRGAAAAIVSLGRDGLVFATPTTHGVIPAVPVAAVDTTGAGDALNAGIAVTLAEGHDLESAARWGVAASALAVTRAGTADAMPSRAAVERVLQAMTG